MHHVEAYDIMSNTFLWRAVVKMHEFKKCFCRIMSIENIFKTKFNPQNNGQVEIYIRTNLDELQTYLADHPRDLYPYKDALNYAYNCQPHTSRSVAPFAISISKIPIPLVLKPML